MMRTRKSLITIRTPWPGCQEHSAASTLSARQTSNSNDLTLEKTMKNAIFTIALLSLFVLSACGGGGGGSSSDSMDMVMTPNNQQTLAQPTTQTAFSGSRPQSTNAIAQNAQSIPNVLQQSGTTIFGSVVQAFTSGIPAVSGVDTSFDGDRFTFRINRQSGSPTTLDTDQDDTYITAEYTPSDNEITDRPAVDGYIVGSSSTDVTVAGVSVEWSNTDFADYLAGGYWLHIDTASLGVEIGAFIDGPDYASVVTVPVTGSATYNGRAAGLYITSYGADISTQTLPTGSVELGEYAGELMLVANFGTSSISGDIRDIDFFDAYTITPNGDVVSLADDPSSDYVLIFGATPIRQNGQFVGNNITLTHPTVNIATTNGSWAGRFSTVDDSSGNPRAVVGTHRGYAATPGGSESVFVGAHYGATNQFQ